jgi:hypothetical protein
MGRATFRKLGAWTAQIDSGIEMKLLLKKVNALITLGVEIWRHFILSFDRRLNWVFENKDKYIYVVEVLSIGLLKKGQSHPRIWPAKT